MPSRRALPFKKIDRLLRDGDELVYAGSPREVVLLSICVGLQEFSLDMGCCLFADLRRR